MKYIVMDTETGGLLSDTHSLLSVALIKTTTRFQELDSIHVKIRQPVFVVTYKAMEKNKIDLRDTQSWVEPDAARKLLLDFLNADAGVATRTDLYPEYTACGTNINFDIGFMKNFLGEVTWNNLFYHRSEDIMSVFRELQKTGVIPTPKGHALHQMLSALGLEFDPDGMHDALYDAQMALAAAREMQRRGDLLKDALEVYVKRHGGDLDEVMKCYRGSGNKSKLKQLRLNNK